jgi:chloride channel protein, CIC family
VLRSASSLCTIASGGSIGREGAMVQLAAAIGSWIGQLGRFEGDKLRLLAGLRRASLRLMMRSPVRFSSPRSSTARW